MRALCGKRIFHVATGGLLVASMNRRSTSATICPRMTSHPSPPVLLRTAPATNRRRADRLRLRRDRANLPRMQPVASKVLQEIRKAKRSQVIDLRAARELREVVASLADDDAEAAGVLPIQHAQWMSAFKLLSQLAHPLLGLRALRKFADRVRELEEELMPGGPPMSPVFDSVFSTFVLADMTVGPRRETLCSILVDLAPALGFAPGFTQAARMLMESRFGVYKVRELGRDRVELTDLFSARRFEAQLPKDLSNRESLWLTRLLPPLQGADGDWVVWTTPYWLDGPDVEDAWRAHAERVVAAVPQSARMERLAAHFKAADHPRRWLDYIMDGYVGVTPAGVVVLTGVPDLPHTLPHHANYDAVKALDPDHEASPLERVRLRVQQCADDAGFPHERVQTDRPDHPAARMMERAYRMYGQLDEGGQSALDLFAARRVELSEPERRMLDALLGGWFSAFEVERVKIDEGLQVRDIFSKRSLWIVEKAATRQLDLGDVLFGWLTVEPDATRFEGALGHVPAQFAQAFVAAMREANVALSRNRPELAAPRRQGLLALRAVEMTDEIVAQAPLPRLVNAEGHDVLLCEARYDVSDVPRTAALLARAFERGPDPATYHWLAANSVRGTIGLNGGTLYAQCDSRERLAELKDRIDSALGACIQHRADSFEDPRVAIRERLRSGEPAARVAAPAPPPAAAKQIQALMLERMRAWVDEPIPMLGGKTPRQAVRTERGRDDVTLMLVRQQSLFDQGAGMPSVDLTAVWRELGLTPRT